MTDGAKIQITIPSRYAGQETQVRNAVHTLLRLTSQCANPWHDSAPARALQLCPEC